MGLEAVIDEITEKGRKEAEAIRRESETEVARILAAANVKSDQIKTAVDEDVARQEARIINQDVSAANLLVKRSQLNAEKALLDQVYAAVLLEVRGASPDIHRAALSSLLQHARAEIGEGMIHASARDLPMVQNLLQEGSYPGFVAGSPVEIDGGIIAESRDGLLKVDYSYRTFLDSVWESGLKDASDILFG